MQLQVQIDPAPVACVTPSLAGIPETMLYTLYARAAEARREDGLLHDPELLRIYDRIDYDFEGRFGTPNRLLALRAALIDGALRRWLARHPEGLVVSLGEGLETQSYRVDNGRMRWLSLDLPEAIRLRELFIAPCGRFQHRAADATDLAWIDRLDPGVATCIVAQGLFMYLEQDSVRGILTAIAARLPGAEVIFDLVSRETSTETYEGHAVTENYDLPLMPWGLNRNEVLPTLRRWAIDAREVELFPYRLGQRRSNLVEAVLNRLVPGRRHQFSLVRLAF